MNNKIYPFKFLDAYTAADKDIFFGRDEEIKQLYQMIYQSDTLLLYGASGTGKTSLIQCGLASQFEQHDWLDIFVRRNKNLNESLEKALLAVGGANEQTSSDSEELDWLDDLMGDADNVVSTKTLSPTQGYLKNIYLRHFRPIYLIFDQFEELFILGNQAEQAQFIQTVQEILQVEQPVKLIFSIREEYLGSLYEFEKAVPALLRKKLRIDPMNLQKAKAVVLGATQSPNSIVHIQPTEADAIAEQIFEKIRGQEKTLTIQLPYLQVFLDKFYRHLSKDQAQNPTTEATFTLAKLSEIGDISDVLRAFLEEQIVEIAKTQRCDAKTIWKILSPFVTVDGTKEPTSMEAIGQQLPDVPKSLIEQVVLALMNRRILRYLEEENLYEVAHDSLALRIAEKRSDEEIALLEVRNLIQTQSLLKDEARELFSEKQLEFIGPYLPLLALTPAEAQLIEASKAQVLKEQREARRRKLLAGILLLLFVATILVAALYSFAQATAAKKAETAAKASEELALVAKSNAETEKQKAVSASAAAEEARQKAEASERATKAALSEAKASRRRALAALKEAKRSKRQAMLAQESAEKAQVAAEISKVQALTAQQASEEAKIAALKANEKNEKIISAMDFYADNFALAFHDGKYGFINKEGEVVIDYAYDKGEPFDPKTGFAEMEKVDLEESEDILSGKTGWAYNKYLVDTAGTPYRLLRLVEVFRNSGSSPYSFSPKDISWLQQQLSNDKTQAPLLQKVNQIEAGNATAQKSLISILNKEKGQLALDCRELPEEQILETLETIAKNSTNREKVALLFLDNTELRKLPDFIGDFNNLKRISLENTNIEELPASFTQLNKLEKLDLSFTPIQSIPKDIGNLSSLKVLRLSPVYNIPVSLFELKNLEELTANYFYVDFSDIDDLDEEKPKAEKEKNEEKEEDLDVYKNIGKLTKLKHLVLEGDVPAFPRSLFQLKNLQTLDIKTAEFDTLPTGIEGLTNLEELRMGAALKEFPKGITQLKKLRKIVLPKSKVKDIPADIGQLKELVALRFGANVTTLPSTLGQLQQLQGFVINAPLTAFPEELLQLDSLILLELLGTQISHIPAEIGQLSNLKAFNFFGPLTTFPEELLQLDDLVILELLNTKISSIPAGINKLSNLYTFEFSGPLTTFPKELLQLKKLRNLSIMEANFETIPDYLGRWETLKKLKLSGHFAAVPSSIGQLEQLTSLVLSSPTLETIPSSIGQLTQLITLDLSGSNLETIPATLGNLKKLTILNLKGSFSELPTHIFGLKNLYTCTLISPNYQSVSSKIGQLTKIAALKLSGSFENLPDNIYNLKNLRMLTLFNCPNLKAVPDLGKFKKLQAFGFILYEGANRDAIFEQLQKFRSDRPKINFAVFDEQGKYVNVSIPDWDIDLDLD
jgi:Leucine-rich repeat (LRR) protein